jgi:hypothetical protein
LTEFASPARPEGAPAKPKKAKGEFGRAYLGERGTKQQIPPVRSDSRRTVILPPDTLQKDKGLEEWDAAITTDILR